MIRILQVAIVVVVLQFFRHELLLGQDVPVGSFVPPKLQLTSSDQFTIDSRKEYDITGEVRWERGKLILPSGSIVGRKISSDRWSKFKLEGNEAKSSSAESVSLDAIVWVYLKGSVPYFIRVHKPSEEKEGHRLDLFSVRSLNGKQLPNWRGSTSQVCEKRVSSRAIERKKG